MLSNTEVVAEGLAGLRWMSAIEADMIFYLIQCQDLTAELVS